MAPFAGVARHGSRLYSLPRNAKVAGEGAHDGAHVLKGAELLNYEPPPPPSRLKNPLSTPPPDLRRHRLRSLLLLVHCALIVRNCTFGSRRPASRRLCAPLDRRRELTVQLL